MEDVRVRPNLWYPRKQLMLSLLRNLFLKKIADVGLLLVISLF